MIAGGAAGWVLAFGSTSVMAMPGVSEKAILAGTLAGGLHAISGPDHLAAVMPACLGQRWWRSSRVGAIWALGHGVSAMLIDFLGFFLKDRLARGAGSAVMMRAVSSWADVAVGASLIIIGAFGIKEARGFESAPADLSAAGNTFDAFGKVQRRNRTIMLNGMLHGFSVDGTPSLAPALALPSAGAVFAFLGAYCLGTILAMGTVTTVIGEGSLRLGSSLEQPDFPKKLSLGSSFIAIAVGLIWSVRALPGVLRPVIA